MKKEITIWYLIAVVVMATPIIASIYCPTAKQKAEDWQCDDPQQLAKTGVCSSYHKVK